MCRVKAYARLLFKFGMAGKGASGTLLSPWVCVLWCLCMVSGLFCMVGVVGQTIFFQGLTQDLCHVICWYASASTNRLDTLTLFALVLSCSSFCLYSLILPVPQLTTVNLQPIWADPGRVCCDLQGLQQQLCFKSALCYA